MDRLAREELKSRGDDASRGNDRCLWTSLPRACCRLWLALAFTCGVNGFAFDQPLGEDDDGDGECVIGVSSGVTLARQFHPLRQLVRRVPQLLLPTAVLQPVPTWCSSLCARRPAKHSRCAVFQRIVSTSL